MSYQISKILVCLDLRDKVLSTLDFAISLSTEIDCEIHVLHVLPHLSQEANQVIRSYIAENNNMDRFEKDRLEHAKSIVESKVSIYNPDKISGINFFIDDPASGIAEYSQEINADMIVLGARKKSLVEAFGGSVAKKVIDKVTIPVVCVP